MYRISIEIIELHFSISRHYGGNIV